MNFLSFDALIGVLAMVGIAPVLGRLFSYQPQNPLEGRLRWLLLSMFIVSLIKIPFMAIQWRFLGGIMYGMALFMAFQVFLYFEALLRRHMPIALKLFAVLGCGFFTLLALFSSLPENGRLLMAFSVYMMTLALWIILVCLLRRRKDYGRSENRFIDLCIFTLFILAPFFLSDIHFFGGPQTPRMGVIGCLLFTFIAIQSESSIKKIPFTLKRLLDSVVISILAIFLINVLIPRLDPPYNYRLFILALCLALVARIFEALRTLETNDAQSMFIIKLLGIEKRSSRKFLAEMGEFYSETEKKILGPHDLKDVVSKDLSNFFSSRQQNVFSLFELREILDNREFVVGLSSAEHELIEKMILIMESHDMNHFCRMDREGITFVLLNLSSIGFGNLARLQVGLVAEVAELIRQRNVADKS